MDIRAEKWIGIVCGRRTKPSWNIDFVTLLPDVIKTWWRWPLAALSSLFSFGSRLQLMCDGLCNVFTCVESYWLDSINSHVLDVRLRWEVYSLLSLSTDESLGSVKENGPHLISKAVELCLKMPELSVLSPGTVGMKEQFEAWGSQILVNHEFASNLMNLFLKRVFTNKVFTAKSLNTKYERMWTNFHCQYRTRHILERQWIE